MSRRIYKDYSKAIPRGTMYYWKKKTVKRLSGIRCNTIGISKTNLSSCDKNTADVAYCCLDKICFSSHDLESSSTADEFEMQNESTVNTQNFDKKTLVEAVLAIFFKGHLTQTASNLIIELINIISIVKIPSNFNSCLKFLENKGVSQKIHFEKRWFCSYCQKIVCIKNRYQRACNFCYNK